MDTPIVSIIIPCYNSKEFIEEAITSACSQTYSMTEVIVIDDGSTAESISYIHHLKKEKYPDLVILSHPEGANCGVSTTRFRGVMAASGKYIAFLDADDCFFSQKIEKQVDLMERSPNVVLCHTGVAVFGDRSQAIAYEKNFGRHPAEPYQFRRCPEYLKRNGICNSSVMVRTDALRKVPFAMPQLFQYEDWLCWALISAYGDFLFLDAKLVHYRVHEKSATAAVNRQALRAQYSLLELKLALVVKSESFMHSIRCFLSAINTIRKIMRLYSSLKYIQKI
jgi:teichuronic acid biosynthesis glycosyltransferase TuaG